MFWSKQMNADKYLRILRREVVMALGCTEPAAVALCAAAGSELLPEKTERVQVLVSPYIYKNGMYVGIPGSKDMVGLPIAAAMGAVRADSSQALEVLGSIGEAELTQAKCMVQAGLISVGVANTDEKVYIEAECSGGNHMARCVIAQYHDQIVRKELDGEVFFQAEAEKDGPSPAEESMTVEGICEFCETVPIESLYILRDVEAVNTKIAQEGMRGEYGLNVGKKLRGNPLNFWQSDVARLAVALTAAAADARMAGCELPVMSTAGSGNQGLTASLPIIVAARQMGACEEKMLRALALSELITIHTKTHIGRLSVLCGCGISAATGVCAGLIRLMDGDYESVASGIRTMVADITGMVCDGAKPGCAIKIATSVQAAFQAASLAIMGAGAKEPGGIICQDIEKTLHNMGRLGNEGMSGANDTILQMMQGK